MTAIIIPSHILDCQNICYDLTAWKRSCVLFTPWPVTFANPSKIRSANGICSLLNHFLTVCAVNAQTCVNSNRCHCPNHAQSVFGDHFHTGPGFLLSPLCLDTSDLKTDREIPELFLPYIEWSSVWPPAMGLCHRWLCTVYRSKLLKRLFRFSLDWRYHGWKIWHGVWSPFETLWPCRA